MEKMIKKFVFGLFAGAAAITLAAPASATFSHNWDWDWCKDHDKPQYEPECLVVATASDKFNGKKYGDSYKNPYFWSVCFKEGCEDAFITSITIDLQAGKDGNAYFDLSGSNSYGPVVGYTKGISSSSVTFSPDSGDTSKLTLTFAEGTFNVGDCIYFGADTDYLKDDNGKSVGIQQVGFSVTFANGTTVSSTFAKTSNYTSTAKAKTDDCCGGTTVPTPAAAAMGVLLLGGIASRRRRNAA